MMSCFRSKKLDASFSKPHTRCMASRAGYSGNTSVMAVVRRRIGKGGERLWRHEDFKDLPSAAVAQALSRLKREGLIDRLAKGTYYRPRKTVFGKSLPSPRSIGKLASRRKPVFPSGVTAANLLGFTTQTARRGEVSTSALSLPRKLIGPDTVVRTRRPEAWRNLSGRDAALLEFLRTAGNTSELSPQDTIRRTLLLLSREGSLDRLLKVADSEPPRVRAMLGALGEELGARPATLRRLHDSLNPLSRFDFGRLSGLPHAKRWQAKEPVEE
jgi:hypothetical protein